jgi:hypothetical protein
VTARIACTVAVLICGALAAAGCAEKQIDTTRAEAEIKRELSSDTGAPLRRVRCPDEVEAKKGDVFRCVAVARDGSRVPIEVTQTDGDGGVRWSVAAAGSGR